MRQIVATAKISPDGVIQGEGGAEEDPSNGFDLGGWSNAFSDAGAGTAVMGLVGTTDNPNDLLLGRRTYDLFANYWPHVPATNPIGPAFNKARKYVLTHRPNGLEWVNTRRVHDIGELSKVKTGSGPDIVLRGSSTVCPQLLDVDLIDRLVLLICPIVLGKGKRLFGSTTHPFVAKLESCKITRAGVLIASYNRSPTPKPRVAANTFR